MIGENRRQAEIAGGRRGVLPRVAVLGEHLRLSRAALLVVALLLFAAFVPAARIARGDGGLASVSPASGTMNTTFTFGVSGMTPGRGVDLMLIDGSGANFTYQQNGVPQALVVQVDGSTAVSVTPATDLPGSVPGSWNVTFTEEETGYNVTIPFDVTP